MVLPFARIGGLRTGCNAGEQPVLREEGVWPADVVVPAKNGVGVGSSGVVV